MYEIFSDRGRGWKSKKRPNYHQPSMKSFLNNIEKNHFSTGQHRNFKHKNQHFHPYKKQKINLFPNEKYMNNNFTNQIKKDNKIADNSTHEVSLNSHRKSLPIFEVRNALLENLKNYDTNIIVGDTGSGKSTQIPQFLYEEGFHKEGKICVTQPRKLAAINLAKRVAQEMGCELGTTVGYAVRFEEILSGKTSIKFMTDGMLLREALTDPLLKKYQWIILDEAHERTVNTDILFGIVKRAQRIRLKKKKKLLKVVVMSATMDVEPFEGYFNKSKVNVVQGNQHEVMFKFPTETQQDYFLTCLYYVSRIHRAAPSEQGILVFLTGQEEITGFVKRVKELMAENEMAGTPEINVFPLYAQLSDYEQSKIFPLPPKNTRKIIISTNVAETSITIPGVKYVIDSGRFKTRIFNANTGFHELQVCRISQAQAMQRAGRAGRERKGLYYSILTKSELESLVVNPVPEILKAELSSTYLTLLGAKVKYPLKFGFLDKPPQKSLQCAEAELRDLGVITGALGNVALTDLGKQMNFLPLKPSYAKILLESSSLGCTEEVRTP